MSWDQNAWCLHQSGLIIKFWRITKNTDIVLGCPQDTSDQQLWRSIPHLAMGFSLVTYGFWEDPAYIFKSKARLRHSSGVSLLVNKPCFWMLLQV